MKTMYLAIYNHSFDVLKKEIVKETENSVLVVEYGRKLRRAKVTQTACYFDTELEAWQWIKNKAIEKYEKAMIRVDLAFLMLNKISEQIKDIE